MERLTKTDRICAIASAAAHDLNDELTIILSSVDASRETLEPGHPARPLIHDLEMAAWRCVWKTSALLTVGERNGVRPSPVSVEHLIMESNDR